MIILLDAVIGNAGPYAWRCDWEPDEWGTDDEDRRAIDRALMFFARSEPRGRVLGARIDGRRIA